MAPTRVCLELSLGTVTDIGLVALEALGEYLLCLGVMASTVISV